MLLLRLYSIILRIINTLFRLCVKMVRCFHFKRSKRELPIEKNLNSFNHYFSFQAETIITRYVLFTCCGFKY